MDFFQHINPPEGTLHLVAQQDDVFINRYKALSKLPQTELAGNFPALIGEYKDWQQYIKDAIEHDARPSLELIKANHHLATWESHLKIKQVSSFPLSIAIGITDVCNANCNFCAYVPERVTNKKVELEQIKRADWLKFCRSFRPNGSSLGEPFAHPDITEILEAVKNNAPYIWMDSLTNGSLLTPKINTVIAGFMQYLYISINAVTQKSYESTMQPLKWKTLLKNLENLNQIKEKMGTHLPQLGAGYVCHVGNLEELLLMPKFLNDWGFVALNVNQMLPPPPFAKSKNPLMTFADSIHNVPERANEVFRIVEQECESYKIRLHKPLPSLELLKSRNVQKQCS